MSQTSCLQLFAAGRAWSSPTHPSASSTIAMSLFFLLLWQGITVATNNGHATLFCYWQGITAVANFAPFVCEEVMSVLETEMCGRVPTNGSAALPSAMRGSGGSSIIIESSEFGGGCSADRSCCGKIGGAEIVLYEVFATAHHGTTMSDQAFNRASTTPTFTTTDRTTARARGRLGRRGGRTVVMWRSQACVLLTPSSRRPLSAARFRPSWSSGTAGPSRCFKAPHSSTSLPPWIWTDRTSGRPILWLVPGQRTYWSSTTGGSTSHGSTSRNPCGRSCRHRRSTAPRPPRPRDRGSVAAWCGTLPPQGGSAGSAPLPDGLATGPRSTSEKRLASVRSPKTVAREITPGWINDAVSRVLQRTHFYLPDLRRRLLLRGPALANSSD